MKSVGNMPEGAEFLWPEFQGEDIFISLLGQYQFIGILIIILLSWGQFRENEKMEWLHFSMFVQCHLGNTF